MTVSLPFVRWCHPLVTVLFLVLGEGTLAAETGSESYPVGLAKIDVTPDYPVRLSGFGSRRKESEGVTQRIWAKALAVGEKDPAVLITVDNVAVPGSFVREVGQRLEKLGVTRDRLAVTSSHTHTAPMLTGALPTLFGEPIPPEHQQHIDRYTRELADHLEKVASAALANRAPARMRWGVGQVDFAVNRRNRSGPVEHRLPMLVVQDLHGKVRGVYVSYACHCVTLGDNKISGDWAGYAQQAVEDAYPGAIALTSIGCGADCDPSSGVTTRPDLASRQGAQIAAEVKRLLGGYLAPVTGPLTAHSEALELPLAPLPDRATWEEKGKKGGPVGYHARVQLAKLERGEKLRSAIDYRIASWTFGDSLAMVFLPGEVVVDYSLRLGKELDGSRLWVNAYSNDVPCYVPSERVLKEGGYEGRDAMVYYDVPTPFAPGLEAKIVGGVRKLLDARFAATFDPTRTGGTLPRSPQQSLAALRTRPGLAVDLVAAEPLVQSPVAIDFGPDGRLWVAEMIDYPAGVKGDYRPGGRVRVLEDTDGDGIFDKSTVFLDNIPFPTGVTAWRGGVLVCAAPDVLYAEDTTGTGKANVVKKLLSGFYTDNYQARVNSLCYGLDGWVHGSCGLFGGRITSQLTGKVHDLAGRDFRFRPDTGEVEAVTGRTQQGLARDDWGNWFGCDNGTLSRHYPLADHYLRRNRLVALPQSAVFLPTDRDGGQLFPAQKSLQLFKNSGPANRVTAACGLGVYRDDLLGSDLRGDLFTCEPVNLLVHREHLTPRGSSFAGHRAEGEKDSEFLASTDGWFRPVQARCGPDGALWVVDLYRFVIEHPRWIPAEDLARLDVRAGHDRGRIYRVRPADRPLRPAPRLDRLSTAGLVAALDDPNGTRRDLAGQLLLWRGDAAAVPPLVQLAGTAKTAEGRLHALCVLDGLGKLPAELVTRALDDAHPGVRRHAVRLAEKFVAAHPVVGEALLRRAADEDGQVRLQLACSLGSWDDPRAGRALAGLTLAHADDPFLTAAALSSIQPGNVKTVSSMVLSAASPPEALARELLTLTAALGDGPALGEVITTVTRARNGRYAAWQPRGLAALLEGVERRGQALESLVGRAGVDAVGEAVRAARKVAEDGRAAESDRVAAIGLLGRGPGRPVDDLPLLGELLGARHPAAVQSAALAAVGRIPDDRAAQTLLAAWLRLTPALKPQLPALLLGRRNWTLALLDALARKELPAGQLDAATRQRLLTHADVVVRTRAEKVLAGPLDADRARVIREYSGVTSLGADVRRGKAVFVRVCVACHRLEGVGNEVGPDLTTVANKSPLAILTEILDPNRNVDSRFVQYAVTTKQGRSLSGLLAAETATSVTLRGPEGKQEVLLRDDLEDLTSSGKSLMPDGLEKDVSRQDMADLLAYLTRTAAPPKRFAGNDPRPVRPVKGAHALLATNGAIHGGAIALEPDFKNVGCWSGADDRVAWVVEVEQKGEFDVWLDWSCANDSAGSIYVLEGGREALRGTVAATGAWNRYRQQRVGKVALDSGTHTLVLRPDGPLKGSALFDLRGIHLVPAGQTPEFSTPGK